MYPTGKLVADVPNDPVPVTKSIETLSEPWLAAARSTNVSLLKTPTATETGARSSAKLVALPNDACTITKEY